MLIEATQVTVKLPYVGQRASFSKTITDADVIIFAGLTGDLNPLHIDQVAASKTRFGHRIAHGTLLMGFISNLLGTKVPGPGTIYLRQDITFLKPTYIGDTVTAAVEVLTVRPEKNVCTLATTCHNQHGVLLVKGEATVMVLPSDNR